MKFSEEEWPDWAGAGVGPLHSGPIPEAHLENRRSGERGQAKFFALREGRGTKEEGARTAGAWEGRKPGNGWRGKRIAGLCASDAS